MEVEKRIALREEGKLEFMGGKQELIRLGECDDVDMAVMCHTASDMGERAFSVGGTSNGHMVKYVQFIGRGAHAGAAPHMGINALTRREHRPGGNPRQPRDLQGAGDRKDSWHYDQGRRGGQRRALGT